jgi:hypothetical protein
VRFFLKQWTRAVTRTFGSLLVVSRVLQNAKRFVIFSHQKNIGVGGFYETLLLDKSDGSAGGNTVGFFVRFYRMRQAGAPCRFGNR